MNGVQLKINIRWRNNMGFILVGLSAAILLVFLYLNNKIKKDAIEIKQAEVPEKKVDVVYVTEEKTPLSDLWTKLYGSK